MNDGEGAVTWREWYHAVYLRSDHWHDVRRRAIERAGRKCPLCGASDCVIEVHHNCYAHLGEERDVDVIALCGECHALFHRERTITSSPGVMARRDAELQQRAATKGGGAK